jgi:hypothetical protein
MLASDSRPAFGDLRTGRIIPARLVHETTRGIGFYQPDVEGITSLENFMPGVIGPTGIFHPGDHSIKPPEGTWDKP